jgi:hypothetical protein
MAAPYPRVEPRWSRMKRCCACKEYWPIRCFQRDRKNPDMHRNECRACRKQRRDQLKAGAPRRFPWETHRTLKDAALAHGLNPKTVSARINRYGWTLYRALKVPTGACKVPVRP